MSERFFVCLISRRANLLITLLKLFAIHLFTCKYWLPFLQPSLFNARFRSFVTLVVPRRLLGFIICISLPRSYLNIISLLFRTKAKSLISSFHFCWSYLGFKSAQQSGTAQFSTLASTGNSPFLAMVSNHTAYFGLLRLELLLGSPIRNFVAYQPQFPFMSNSRSVIFIPGILSPSKISRSFLTLRTPHFPLHGHVSSLSPIWFNS